MQRDRRPRGGARAAAASFRQPDGRPGLHEESSPSLATPKCDLFILIGSKLFVLVKSNQSLQCLKANSTPNLIVKDLHTATGQMREQTPKMDLKEPFKVVNVEFEGVTRTRPTLLAKIVAEIFTSESLEDFLLKYRQVHQKLDPLFSNVDVKVEPANEETETDHVITFVVNERSRRTLGTEVQTDGYTSHLNLNLSAPNLNGIGDAVRLTFKSNSLPKIQAFECDYTIPLVPWKLLYNPVCSIGYSQFQHTSTPSAYDQENKSFINRVEFFSNPNLKHSLSFMNTWTHIKSHSANTPLVIREQSGHFLKSYIKYAIQYDSRPQGENFPSVGILAKLTSDLSTNLFKKGARFARQEIELQLNKLLLPQQGLLGQVNLYAGTLMRPSKIDISDKFFPGGPPTFRGYALQGFGPHVRKHPLGDISYLTAGIHLYPILPGTTTKSKINEFVRPHLFVNAGTTGDLNRSWRLTSRADLEQEVLNFKDSLRYTCGFGVLLAFRSIRFELNYCLPLKTKENDLSMGGVQFGFYAGR